MKKLLTILTILLVLTACTSKKVDVAQIEVKDNTDPIILKVDDKNKLQDYLKDYKLEDADKVDLSKEGEHTITLITKDNKKIVKTIYITSNVEETTKKITDKAKQEAEKKKPATSTTKQEDKKETNKPAATTSSTKQETASSDIRNGIYAESNTSGLDTSNHIVNFAQTLVGQGGLCDDIADRMLQYIHNRPQSWINYPKHRVGRGEAQIGDIILYDYNPDLGYGHIATYLGNGLAIHGNMGSAGHTAVISSVDVPNLQNPTFYRMEVENMPAVAENSSASGDIFPNKGNWTKEDCKFVATDENEAETMELEDWCYSKGYQDLITYQ